MKTKTLIALAYIAIAYSPAQAAYTGSQSETGAANKRRELRARTMVSMDRVEAGLQELGFSDAQIDTMSEIIMRQEENELEPKLPRISSDEREPKLPRISKSEVEPKLPRHNSSGEVEPRLPRATL